MKILSLKAANVLNLQAIDISPKGSTVTLSGKNGAGKSAVLDAIEIAMTGRQPEDLIRHGEKKGTIEVKTEEYTVKRIYTEKTDRIELTSADGKPCKSPQALLDKIIGNLSFDPLSFKNMDPRKQCEFLTALVGLNFDKEKKRRQEIYDERTLAGRDQNRHESAIKSSTEPDKSLPVEETPLSEQMVIIGALENKKKAHDYYLDEIASIDKTISDTDEAVAAALEEIKILQERVTTMQDNRKRMVEKKSGLPEPEKVTDEQITEAREKLTTIDQKNQLVRDAKEYREHEEGAKKAKAEFVRLTESIEKIDQDIQQRIKNAKYPIEGLAIGEESVTYKGVPFRQLSSGEAMRVSTAIAMALNPNLRIIMVRDATLLDSDGMKVITEMAAEKDYQLWIERMDESGKVGIYLEDGQIKNEA